MEGLILSDGDIAVRPYRSEDAVSLYEAARESHREVFVWLPWCHPHFSLAESQDWVNSQFPAKERTEYGFAITDSMTGDFLGGIGLNHFNHIHNIANLGYWVRTKCTGRGIAARSARLVARFGLFELRLSRIEIIAAVSNLASQRVAEKAGARREGVLRRRLTLHGQCHDAVMFSLIAQDFE